MGQRLATKMPDWPTRRDFLTTVQYEATRAGLDPQLVLGLIQLESNFRKYAVSGADARGYGDAVLGKADRHARSQSVQSAHQSALRLHDPAALSRHGERRLLSSAGSVQRQPDDPSTRTPSW
jgi:hypothetical protein